MNVDVVVGVCPCVFGIGLEFDVVHDLDVDVIVWFLGIAVDDVARGRVGVCLGHRVGVDAGVDVSVDCGVVACVCVGVGIHVVVIVCVIV